MRTQDGSTVRLGSSAAYLHWGDSKARRLESARPSRFNNLDKTNMEEQKKQQVRQQSESIEAKRRREYIEGIPKDIPTCDLISIIGETFGHGYKEGFKDGAYWALDLVENQFKGKQFKQEENNGEV